MAAGNVVTWALDAVDPGQNGERRLRASVESIPPIRWCGDAGGGGESDGGGSCDRGDSRGHERVPRPRDGSDGPIRWGRATSSPTELTVTNRNPTGVAGVHMAMQMPWAWRTVRRSPMVPRSQACALRAGTRRWSLALVAKDASKTVLRFRTLATVLLLPNGTILHAVAQAQDGPENSAPSATSAGVLQ